MVLGAEMTPIQKTQGGVALFFEISIFFVTFVFSIGRRTKKSGPIQSAKESDFFAHFHYPLISYVYFNPYICPINYTLVALITPYILLFISFSSNEQLKRWYLYLIYF